jgi:hypothetical protein
VVGAAPALSVTTPVPVPVAGPGSYSQASYVRQLKLLMPPGVAFDLEEGTSDVKVLEALADELARVDGRGVDLINEADPRTADETIADWEQALSLPDDQIPVIPATLAERRIAVTQKYTNRGGQNTAFFTALAAACGYTLAGGTLPVPVISSVTNSGAGGILGPGTYSYKVTAFRYSGDPLYPYNGETTASAAVTTVAGAGLTHKTTVNWARVPGADGYRVYGRTGGAEHFITEIPDTGAGTYAFDDTGSIAPTSAPPGANTATYPAIEKFAKRMLRCTSRMTDRFYGVSWAFSMRLHIQPVVGSPLAQANFERVIRHVTHSHIYAVIFIYH